MLSSRIQNIYHQGGVRKQEQHQKTFKGGKREKQGGSPEAGRTAGSNLSINMASLNVK